MTFSEASNKSVNRPRILVQVDIPATNVQWINAGAGIWYCNLDGLYPEVDASLLTGFTAQYFGFGIGSVRVDNVWYIKLSSLGAITDSVYSYWTDVPTGSPVTYIYIHSNIDPMLVTVTFGVILGFSYDDFVPIGSVGLYNGRLLGSIETNESRDPLFFGKISYDISSITLVNNDGYFDGWSDSDAYNFYGSELRILFGYDEINISEYIVIFKASIEQLTISEDTIEITTADQRKTLTKEVEYSCTNKNALEAIRELLGTHYFANYTSDYYNIDTWAAAELVAPNVTITIASGMEIETKPVIDIIEEICVSVFGIFKIDANGKYDFKMINLPNPSVAYIDKYNIHEKNVVVYDPTEVISSAKIGYAKYWGSSTVDPYYTYLVDTAQESYVYGKYKVYNQREFNTLLPTLAEAQEFSTRILEYNKEVHGTGTIKVPMSFYTVKVGDAVYIELLRQTTNMIGICRCEILGKKYSLFNNYIEFYFRIITFDGVISRITTYGDTRVDTYGNIRVII